jgi:cytoskeletal protein CcmA (bactofilin family)
MVWNKRTDDDVKSKQAAPVAEPPAPPRAAPAPPPPAAPVSAAAFRPELPRSSAVLGESVVVKGQIFSKEDLTIEGDVQGTIDLADHRLTIGPKGKVVVDIIKAREVIVMGSLKGAIDATDKVFIRKDAQLIGDVQTAGIVIEDGAYFKGGIDIRKPDTSRK